jgi:hypothetical protein
MYPLLQNGGGLLEKIQQELLSNDLKMAKIYLAQQRRDLKLKIYYNGVLVANSTDNFDNNKQVVIYESINNIVYHSFDIMVNKSSIELAYNIKSNASYIIDYELSLKLFGFSVNYKGKYKNN